MRKVYTPKMSLRTRYHYFEFLVMIFGLRNALASFIYLINSVFRKYFHFFVIEFIDDMLIYFRSENSQVRNLTIVFQVLKDNKKKFKV